MGVGWNWEFCLLDLRDFMLAMIPCIFLSNSWKDLLLLLLVCYMLGGIGLQSYSSLNYNTVWEQPVVPSILQVLLINNSSKVNIKLLKVHSFTFLLFMLDIPFFQDEKWMYFHSIPELHCIYK